jgi:DNA gyrase subunit B
MMPESLFKSNSAAQARHAAKKAREMVQRKTVMGGGGLVSFLIVQSKILQNAKCILSREIRQEERLQGRDRKFQAILPHVVRF